MMNNKNLLIIFILTQIFLIFAYIHKESRFINISYQKQKNEKKLISLINKNQEIKETLLAEQNLNKIQKIAQNELKMKKINSNQIKRI